MKLYPEESEKRLVPSTKEALRLLAREAMKVAKRKRKHKILRVVPEGETGALKNKKGEVIKWRGRTGLKKLGKRKRLAKMRGQLRYQWRMTRFG